MWASSPSHKVGVTTLHWCGNPHISQNNVTLLWSGPYHPWQARLVILLRATLCSVFIQSLLSAMNRYPQNALVWTGRFPSKQTLDPDIAAPTSREVKLSHLSVASHFLCAWGSPGTALWVSTHSYSFWSWISSLDLVISRVRVPWHLCKSSLALDRLVILSLWRGRGSRAPGPHSGVTRGLHLWEWYVPSAHISGGSQILVPSSCLQDSQHHQTSGRGREQGSSWWSLSQGWKWALAMQWNAKHKKT